MRTQSAHVNIREGTDQDLPTWIGGANEARRVSGNRGGVAGTKISAQSRNKMLVGLGSRSGAMGMFKINCCDGIYNSLDVHFTSACDNRCRHCIDKRYSGYGVSRPNARAIAQKIIDEQDGLDDVLFLGGEPCLYLQDLYECVVNVKQNTALKVFVTTSVPKVCAEQRDLFEKLLRILDGINLSVQHYDENVADQIRNVPARYDRQAFYRSLPYKEKIRINLNIVKPYLYRRDDLVACLEHYDKMGFNSIKLSEIQHGKEHFVSFEGIFGMKMKSAFAHGCQQYVEMQNIIPGFKTPLLLKRSCFMCEETLKASLMDGLKVLYKLVSKPTNKYGVIYGDGHLQGGWQ
jgi:organic radical activating enzyme